MDESIFIEQSAISREEQEGLDALYALSYWFGAFLGDGYAWWYPYYRNNKYGVGIDCMDSEIVLRCIQLIKNFVPELRGNFRWWQLKSGTVMYQARYNNSEFTQFMIHATNDKEKIPDFIWRAPKSVKMEMLIGLMDTDGTISGSPRQRESRKMNWRLIFSGKKGFVRQFSDLCRVCGIQTSEQLSQRDGTINFRLSGPDAFHNGFTFRCMRKNLKWAEYLADSYGHKGGRPLNLLQPSETTRSDSHSE